MSVEPSGTQNSARLSRKEPNSGTVATQGLNSSFHRGSSKPSLEGGTPRQRKAFGREEELRASG